MIFSEPDDDSFDFRETADEDLEEPFLLERTDEDLERGREPEPAELLDFYELDRDLEAFAVFFSGLHLCFVEDSSML